MQSEGEIVGWLGRRLKKILVPYWLALTAMLLLNYAFHYKPATLGLILAQYAGIAGFTHPLSLIGVQTWFISVILACYLLAALIRFDRIFLPLSVVVALALLLNHAPNYWGCILQFLAGGRWSRRRRASPPRASPTGRRPRESMILR